MFTFSWLDRWRLRSRAPRRPGAPSRRPGVEVLEDRCLLSTYTVTDLGTLPGGSYSVATAINNAGQVAGYSTFLGGTARHAYFYSAGHITDLQTLPGFIGSTATALNDAGQVVGDAYNTSPIKHHAFLYDGDMTDLGTLGGENSKAFGINNGGEVVGYTTLAGSLTTHAFTYQDGVMTALPEFPGSNFSWAYAVNDAGQVVGKAGAGAVYNAIVWNPNGTFTDLGTLGGSDSVATAINAAGDVAGAASPADGSSLHAFLYSAGQMIDLGALGGDYSYANGLNDAGVVVGTTGTGAFVFSDGQMVDLNGLLSNGDGWNLVSANAINDQGQIVGNGFHDELPRSFLLTPDEPPVAASLRPVALSIDPLSAQAPTRLHSFPAGLVSITSQSATGNPLPDLAPRLADAGASDSGMPSAAGVVAVPAPAVVAASDTVFAIPDPLSPLSTQPLDGKVS